LFLALFFIFVGVVIRRISRFIAIHKKSIIHELDDALITQVEITKNHCVQTINQFNNLLNNLDKNDIESMITILKTLEEQYKKNSHGLLLLGPIGTISIVLKERTIKTKLLEIVIKLHNILLKHSKHNISMQPITTIEEGITINQKLLF